MLVLQVDVYEIVDADLPGAPQEGVCRELRLGERPRVGNVVEVVEAAQVVAYRMSVELRRRGCCVQ